MNDDVRLQIARSKVQKSDVSEELGINQSTFSRWLNDAELPEWKKILVLEAIERVAEQKASEAKGVKV